MTLRTVQTLAKKYNATVERFAQGFNIDAPHGKLWRANGAHHLCCPSTCVGTWEDSPKSWRDDTIADAIERMNCGLYDCDNVDCEWCNES